jgi:ataxia telangiectasia mutated family protein
MEQVFSVINQQLGKDEVASQRRLRFRTYNVLPLANSNGIIEFVPHTMAVGDWLVPAHLG